MNYQKRGLRNLGNRFSYIYGPGIQSRITSARNAIYFHIRKSPGLPGLGAGVGVGGSTPTIPSWVQQSGCCVSKNARGAPSQHVCSSPPTCEDSPHGAPRSPQTPGQDADNSRLESLDTSLKRSCWHRKLLIQWPEQEAEDQEQRPR